jgi:predicted dehydrogenase
MGPYYLTALVNLMGSVKEVSGMTNKAFDKRIITSQPLFGNVIDVEVDTHVTGLLKFENGAVATIITSFDVWNSTLPRIEIYGTKGSLTVPDPNTFAGPVMLATRDGGGFREIPLTHIYNENSRGVGLSDMAQCIIDGRTDNKASGKLANHVLEVMCAIGESEETGKTHIMKSSVKKPEPLGNNLIKGYVK